MNNCVKYLVSSYHSFSIVVFQLFTNSSVDYNFIHILQNAYCLKYKNKNLSQLAHHLKLFYQYNTVVIYDTIS